MKTIWKFAVPIDDELQIKLPSGAEVLCVQLQGGVPTIWAIVNPRAKPELRTFYVCGTGNPIPERPMRYLGTFQQQPFVWHLFEAGGPAPQEQP